MRDTVLFIIISVFYPGGFESRTEKIYLPSTEICKKLGEAIVEKGDILSSEIEGKHRGFTMKREFYCAKAIEEPNKLPGSNL